MYSTFQFTERFFTNYLICSLNNAIFVDIGALDLLMGIEGEISYLGFAGLQTGRAGANPALLMLMSRIISLKRSRIFVYPTYSHCLLCKSVFTSFSVRLEEKDSQLKKALTQLIGGSCVDCCFRQVMHWLALYLMSSVEDPWISLLLSWLKRDFGVL